MNSELFTLISVYSPQNWFINNFYHHFYYLLNLWIIPRKTTLCKYPKNLGICWARVKNSISEADFASAKLGLSIRASIVCALSRIASDFSTKNSFHIFCKKRQKRKLFTSTARWIQQWISKEQKKVVFKHFF